jgi:hypothetical protein
MIKRFVLRVEPNIYESLRKEAKAQDRSINSMLITIIKEYLGL